MLAHICICFHKKCVCLISLVFLLGLLGMVDNASALVVKKGPYLIYPGNNTQMTVLWQLDATSSATLAWGLDTSYSTGSANTTEDGNDHQHKYTITDLTAGTKYYYRVTAGALTQTGSFRTAPAADATSVKILAYGDTRSSPANHNVVCSMINSTIAGDAAYQTLLLHDGDWCSSDAESSWADQYFNRSYSAALQTQATLPIIGTMGNHEDSGTYYTKYWPYPYVAARYWSFDYGPAHITVIDQYTTYTPGSTQYNWLVSDLNSSTKPWKFILIHKPGWSAGGGHSNDTVVQNYIQPLCVTYGVQIVFAGHNHYYARAVVNGVQHITAGGGGATLYAPQPGQPNIVVSNSCYSFCKVDIDGNSLVFQAIKATDGTVIDTFSIPDTTPPNPNPMTWASVPSSTGPTSITMTATTATDISGVEYYFNNVTDPNHDSNWRNSSAYTDTGLTTDLSYTYMVKARDKSVAQNETNYSETASAIPVADTTAPIPNPMTWASAPHGTNLYSISMTATTATDISGVEYMFTCTAGSGHSSSWQASTTYTDTGLAEGSICTYTVKARDKSPNYYNETMPSDPCTATTLLDTTAPEPNQMTFAVAPHATDINSIAMTATTATDISGVEYYFANITDPNHNSGWQDDTNYTDTALINGKTYSYRVKARDKSLGHNETTLSAEANATTLQYTCSGAIVSDLDENCKVDYRDYAIMAEHWGDVLPLTNNIAVNGTFDTDIVPGWQAFDLPSAVGEFLFMYDGDYGNPVGSAVMGGDTGATGISGHYFYQVIPVRAGKQYKLSAEWMGDLSGYVSSDPCHLSNWAQVLVSFETSPDANTWTVWIDPNAVMYAKVFGVADKNIDSSGTWPTWEPITASQTNGPADGIFTASGNYMVVAFSEGGLPSSGVGYFYADTVKVEGPACPTIDLNGDCSLDWLDIQKFAQDWLSCNRNPASECLLP